MRFIFLHCPITSSFLSLNVQINIFSQYSRCPPLPWIKPVIKYYLPLSVRNCSGVINVENYESSVGHYNRTIFFLANLTPLGLKRNNDKTALTEDGYFFLWRSSNVQWGMLQRTMLQRMNATKSSFYQLNQDATTNTDVPTNAEEYCRPT